MRDLPVGIRPDLEGKNRAVPIRTDPFPPSGQRIRPPSPPYRGTEGRGPPRGRKRERGERGLSLWLTGRKLQAMGELELGSRDNAGKLRWRLLPWEALREVAKVSNFGAAKYGEGNWEKGLKASETFDSLMRHAIAWWLGEDRDQESGLPHLAHAAWNALALLTFALRGRGELDDRPTNRPRLENPPIFTLLGQTTIQPLGQTIQPEDP